VYARAGPLSLGPEEEFHLGAIRCSIYSLYYYQKVHTLTQRCSIYYLDLLALRLGAVSGDAVSLSFQFTCFTGTKFQILTQKAVSEPPRRLQPLRLGTHSSSSGTQQ
jgi:hypothetical protein